MMGDIRAGGETTNIGGGNLSKNRRTREDDASTRHLSSPDGCAWKQKSLSVATTLQSNFGQAGLGAPVSSRARILKKDSVHSLSKTERGQ